MIEVRNLTKTFGDVHAVDDISFDVARGEIFAFLGPNGAGKTTTIKMLTTLLRPTKGTLTLDGLDPGTHQNQVRQRFGIVFQDPSLDSELTAWENLQLHAVLYHVPRAARAPRAETLLKLFELWDRRHDPVKQFSGGMKRRLEIARGFLHTPKILFLDEPTLGLDPQSRNQLWTHVKHLNQTEGVTVFLTTHYMDEADRLCDRIAIVDKGRLVALDTPRALKDAVPGATAIEARVNEPPAQWEEELLALDGVASAHALGGDTWRLVAVDAGRAATALVTHAQSRGVSLQSLSVTSTTLDDVFAHYAGHSMGAGAAAAAPPSHPLAGRGGR